VAGGGGSGGSGVDAVMCMGDFGDLGALGWVCYKVGRLSCSVVTVTSASSTATQIYIL